jgi:hypothetical protein
MADAVQAIAQGVEPPAGVPQTVRYPLFTFPTEDELKRQRAFATDGRARALFEAWRPLCTHPVRLILPDQFPTPATVTLQPRTAE